MLSVNLVFMIVVRPGHGENRSNCAIFQNALFTHTDPKAEKSKAEKQAISTRENISQTIQEWVT